MVETINLYNLAILVGSVNTVRRASTEGAGCRAMPQLGSVNTVQRAPTGGAGGKPLLGSANTVWCWVRLG
jgi:hypothetical protein